MRHQELEVGSSGSEPAGLHSDAGQGGTSPSCVMQVTRAGYPAARACAACVRRSLRVAVVGGNGLANSASAASLRAQARCWTWHFFGSDCDVLTGVRSLSPDVLVLTANLPAASGWPCTRQFKAYLPELRVLSLAEAANKPAILRSLQGGAHGCLVSPISPMQVACAVAALANGLPNLCPEAQAAVLDFLHGVGRASSESKLGYAEHLVMQSLVLGKQNKDIATKLNLSEETVHSHLVRIFKKLNVHSREEARSKYLRLYGGGP